jgi:hypothetical protein
MGDGSGATLTTAAALPCIMGAMTLDSIRTLGDVVIAVPDALAVGVPVSNAEPGARA